MANPLKEPSPTPNPPESKPRALLDEIADRSGGASLELPSGRRVEAEPTGAGERLRVTSPNGQIELTVLLTDQGPVLQFRGADVELASTGRVSIDCEQMVVRASDGIEHRTGGDLTEVVAGNRSSRVGESSTAVAADTRIESTRGNVDIEANDDVALQGERIKLNC